MDKNKEKDPLTLEAVLEQLKHQTEEMPEPSRLAEKKSGEPEHGPQPEGSSKTVEKANGNKPEDASPQDPKESLERDKRMQSKIKLDQFLNNTKNIYSSYHHDSKDRAPLFNMDAASTIHNEKVTKEDVERFRKYEITEGQILRYQQFKKLRNAKADSFNLELRPEDPPNQEVNLPELNLTGEEEEADDQDLEYNKPEDAARVQESLLLTRRRSLWKTIALFVLGLFGLFPMVEAQFGLPAPELLTVGSPLTYLLYQVVLLVGAGAVSWQLIRSGLQGIPSLQVNRDTLSSLPAIFCLIQLAALIAMGGRDLLSDNVFVLAPLAVLGLAFSYWSKYLTAARAVRNFAFVSAREYDQYISGIIANEDLAAAFTRGAVSRKPIVSFNRKSGFLSNFIYYSFVEDFTDRFSFYLVPAGLGISVVLGAIAGYMASDFMTGLTAFTAGVCVSAPLCYLVHGNLLFGRVQKKLSKYSAVALGYDVAEDYNGLNAVLSSAHDLFPKGTVVMQGMRTFNSQPIDQSILDAASVLSASNSILRDMFMEVILNREELLKPVDSVVFEDTMGVSAWADNRRVIIGNREMLINHNIIVPEEAEEKKFCPEGCELVYLSVSGVLSAAFVFTIRSDEMVRETLERLSDQGVYLVVQTVDPVVTKEKLSAVFGVEEDLFKILPARFHKPYQKQTAELEEGGGPLANNGKFFSYVQSVLTARRLKPIVLLGMTLSVASIALALILLFVLGAVNGIGEFHLLALVIYELVWAALLALYPYTRRL